MARARASNPACTPSMNRHAGFVQTYEFKSVSKADSLKFGIHPDQATRTAAIGNIDRYDSSKRPGRRVDEHRKQWRDRIWCLSPTHTGRRMISPLATVCPPFEHVVLGRSPYACGLFARRRAARRDAERMICCTLREDLLVEVSKLARAGRDD